MLEKRRNYRTTYNSKDLAFEIRNKDWWPAYSYKIFCRDKFTCQMCLLSKTVDELTAHHIRLYSEGGSNEPKNLLTLCKECHMKIHSIDWTKNIYGEQEEHYDGEFKEQKRIKKEIESKKRFEKFAR